MDDKGEHQTRITYSPGADVLPRLLAGWKVSDVDEQAVEGEHVTGFIANFKMPADDSGIHRSDTEAWRMTVHLEWVQLSGRHFVAQPFGCDFFADGHRISSEEIAHATRETHVLRGRSGIRAHPLIAILHGFVSF